MKDSTINKPNNVNLLEKAMQEYYGTQIQPFAGKYLHIHVCNDNTSIPTHKHDEIIIKVENEVYDKDNDIVTLLGRYCTRRYMNVVVDPNKDTYNEYSDKVIECHSNGLLNFNKTKLTTQFFHRVVVTEITPSDFEKIADEWMLSMSSEISLEMLKDKH